MKENELKSKLKLSVVIPAYNEEENIAITINTITSAINKLKTELESYEILVIDDHSQDKTFQNIKEFRELNSNSSIKALRLSRRSGSHIAIRAGLDHSSGDVVLCMAADGQDDPNVIVEMIKKWSSGSQVVWALRKKREEKFFQKLFAILFYKIIALLINNSNTSNTNNNSNFDTSRADFYLIDKIVVEAVKSCKEKNTSLFGLLIWLGFKQDFVEYERKNRRFGCSGWSFRAKINLATDWIISFSNVPIRLLTFAGIAFIFLAFIICICIAIILANAINVPLSSTIAFIIVFSLLTGLQMICFGILGEYISRNYDEAKRRPLYFIEDQKLN
ncbi:MAG: glycosyltransferase family 2 protein [Oligoflexia bacterium]|nr:glycosyltransferase family 2 protein [Oligoflexia bacterium]